MEHFGHSKWDNYFRTQQTGQLYQDTVDGTFTIGHSRQDSQLHYDTLDLIIMLGHTREDGYIMTQQNRWLHWDTVVTITYQDTVDKTVYDTLDLIIMLGHIRHQMVKLHQDTVGCIVTLDTIDRTQQMGQQHYNTVDRMLHPDTVNWRVPLRHSRQGHSRWDSYNSTPQTVDKIINNQV